MGMRMRADKWSLAVVAATVIAITAFAVISWQSYDRLREGRVAQFHVEGQRVLLTVSDRTARLLDSADSFLRAVRADYLEHGPGDHLHQFIDATRPLRAESFSSIISIADKTGQIIFNTSPTGWQNMRVDRLEHFETFHKDPRDRLFIDPTRKGVVTKRQQFRIVRPLLKGGEFDGDILLGLLPDELSSFFEEFRLGEHSVLTIMTLDHRMIVRHPQPPEDSFEKPLDNLMIWSKLAQSSTGDYSTDSPIDRVPRHYFYRHLDGYPLVIVVGIAEQDILDSLAGARRDGLTQVVVFAVAATLFCALVLLVLRKNRTLYETHGLLAESRDLSRALMNAVTDSFLLIERDGRLLALNEPFARKYGRTATNIVGANVFDLFSPDVAQQRRRAVDKLLETRAAFTFTDQQDDRFYEHHLYPIADATGEIRRIAISASDVTERKRSEAALKEVGDRLNLALQSAGAGAWDWDLPSNHAVWDERMYDIYRCRPNPGEHLFEMWARCLHPDDAGQTQQKVNEALAGSATFDTEYRIVWPDQEVRTIKASAVVVRDQDGRALRMAGLNWDITDLRRVELRLRDSQSLLNAVSALQSEFILTADVRSISDKVLLAVLKATDSQYGFFAELVEGEGARYLQALAISNIAWDDSTRRFYDEHAPTGFRFTNFDGLFAAAIVSGAPVIANTPARYPHRRGLPPGHPPLNAFLGIPMFQGETIIGCLGLANRPGGYDAELLRFIEPLTTACAQFIFGYRMERARSEATQALVAAKQEAEQASGAKSMFLAMMSHEIRTPITGVLGMADLLRHTPLNEEQVGYLNTLAASTKTLLTILNDILDISRIEAGKIVFEEEEFGLQDAVFDTIAMFKATAASKGLSLTGDLADDVPLRVIGDPARFKQLLFNLTGNAIKFTEVGEVNICLSVTARQEAVVTVQVEIEDTGMGMAADQLPSLFIPFSQLGASTARRFGGTGLGLAITKRLIEMMGGVIGVDSQPGKGSHFWFSLPFRVVPSRPCLTADEAVVEVSQIVRPLRILLAEDNRINQMLVRSMLQKFGHTVEVADNGRIAVEAVAAGDFDAVLMDMQMPEMDGEEATRVIRAMAPPKNRLPVLALTADAMVGQRDRYLAAGVNDLVPKPIDWQVLLAALATYTTQDDPPRVPGLLL